MSFEAALIVAGLIIVASIVVVAAVFQGRKRAEEEEELKQAASMRGWTFASMTEKGYRVHRWSGTADGVPWTAESLKHASRGHNSDRAVNICRWNCAFSPGISGAVLAMGLPKGKEQFATAVAQSDNFLAKMAQKVAGFALDKAIDVYFGDEAGTQIDAAATHRVDTATVAGFVVMSADKDEGTRVLSQGLEKALLDGTSDAASALSDQDRPWVLLRPNTISLARMTGFRDVKDIERFIHAGVALTRAFRFGHR
jgi:hypothetical protein